LLLKENPAAMEGIRTLSEPLVLALGRLALNPFLYIGIAFIALQIRRQIILERKFFSSRLKFLPRELIRTLLWGVAAGLAASLLMAFIGIRLEADTGLLLWVIALGLLLLRVRYFTLAYAAGVLGLLQLLLGLIPGYERATGPAGWFYAAVMGVDLPALFALVAILHMVQGGMILLQEKRLAAPLYVESKRGKIVGAFQLQGFWPVPLFLLTPVTDGTLMPPWQPLFSGNWSVSGWGLLAFPAVIGFTQMTLSFLPRVKLRQQAGLMWISGAIVLGASLLAAYWRPFAWALPLLAILSLEAITWYSSRLERYRSPIYVSGAQGIKILGIMPGSAAENMGLAVGESILKANGERVESSEELHQAIRLNSAFCKLEVANLEGQSKFVSTPLFEDQHHQLGLLLAPDHKTLFYLQERPFPFTSYVRRKWMGVIHKQPESMGRGQ